MRIVPRLDAGVCVDGCVDCWAEIDWCTVGCLGQHMVPTHYSHSVLWVCGVWVVVPVAHRLLAGRLGWLVVVGVVCENCIVDASILFFVCVCFVCVLGYSCVCLLFKGAWWMPWHAEPMKDV